jgi:hypothetical protein
MVEWLKYCHNKKKNPSMVPGWRIWSRNCFLHQDCPLSFLKNRRLSLPVPPTQDTFLISSWIWSPFHCSEGKVLSSFAQKSPWLKTLVLYSHVNNWYSIASFLSSRCTRFPIYWQMYLFFLGLQLSCGHWPCPLQLSLWASSVRHY